MYIHRIITMIKYWMTRSNQNENSLLHKTNIILKNELGFNGNNWVHNIKQILIEQEMSFV